MNSEIRNCQNCKNQFTIEPDDFSFYEKIKVPPPTFCPQCRLQRRMTWRNERSLYKRNCDLCKTSIISIYKPQSPFKVYCHDCFRSDTWDPLSYGRNYDFTKPFFQQFHELQIQVPRLNLMVTDCVDSDYINGAYHDKNCYLIFASDEDEDCAYSHSIFYCKNVYDCLGVHHAEWCAGDVNCEKIFNTYYSQDCFDSYNLFFCTDCANCHDCIGCTGLRNQSYSIFNQRYSKEEYSKRLAEMKLGTVAGFSVVYEKARQLKTNFPVKYYHGNNNLRSEGDYLFHCKASSSIFDCQNIEDSKYLYIGNRVKDSYDGYAIVDNIELNLEVISHNSSFSKFCLSYWHGTDGTYGDTCESCNNVFGCIGLRNKQYCILNKQYAKEEYEALVPKIIEHMKSMPYMDRNGKQYGFGEFYPSEISPFAYNETVAQEFFPLTKSEIQKNFSWFEPENKNYKATLTSFNLPQDIKDAKDDLTKEVVECEHNGKCGDQCTSAFRLLSSELDFYRKANLPLPRLCSNCRHFGRMRSKNPLKLWHGKCQCAGEKSANGVYANTGTHSSHAKGESCPSEFETSYSPERPEIVYCEQCYNAEVV